jgi:hypothetical protein
MKSATAHLHAAQALRCESLILTYMTGQVLAVDGGWTVGGYLSLEPHLPKDNPDHGSTGAERFKTAADALKEVLRNIDGATI